MMMRDKNEDFVKICRILSVAPNYNTLPVHMLHRYTYPLVYLGQYKVFDKSFVTWSWFSDEVEKKFIEGSQLIQPEDHNTGENFWYIDLICLGGKEELKEIKESNLRHFGHLTRKYMRVFRKNKHRYVVEQPPIC
jgi:hemolysin-activating ACP:hemolysin acyltransferase|tara:strand:- start:797 stop:1201 length:405 start_codon:yes stop_codon:yes gene_type:complete